MSGTIYFVIAQDGFRDEELVEPLELVKSAGYETRIASKVKGPCKGKLGLEIESDVAISDITIDEDVVALVLVGGPGTPTLIEIPELQKKLSQAKDENKLLGAICLAPMVLAHFDLIVGKKATVFPSEEALAALKAHGVSYVKEDVLVDAGLVTANGPHAATAFGHTLIDELDAMRLNQ